MNILKSCKGSRYGRHYAAHAHRNAVPVKVNDMTSISDQITRIRDIIVSAYQPDQIILFGSRARGDAGEDSDVDLLVISDREKHLPRYRRGLQVRLLLAEIDLPKDILFYTHEDIERWRGVANTFVDTALTEGVALYER